MTKSQSFAPESFPDLTGFVVIVTGGHSGLGLYTTIELLKKGAKVYILSRSKQKVGAAIKDIKEQQKNANVDVKKAADEFLRKETKLHILINNAGIMCPPFTLTPQSNESQLQTNHLSPFLLTSLLLPLLLSTAAHSPPFTVRMINVSSDGASKLAPKEGILFDDMNAASKSTWTRYGMSKLAGVLFARELARRYKGKGLVALSLHPGTVKTNLSSGPRSSTPLYKLIQPLIELGAPGPEKGCWNTLWCAASPEVKEEQNGGFFLPVGRKAVGSKWEGNVDMGERLWRWSEGILGEWLK